MLKMVQICDGEYEDPNVYPHRVINGDVETWADRFVLVDESTARRWEAISQLWSNMQGEIERMEQHRMALGPRNPWRGDNG